MKIDETTLRAAFAAMSPTMQERLLSSSSVKHGKTAVTLFAAALLAELLAQLSPPTSPACWKAYASFKGNLSGATGGSRGGLSDLALRAGQVLKAVDVDRGMLEILVDVLVANGDVLQVVMTMESEARPIANPRDVHDFDKLLLVSSPRRLFVSRVNVPPGGGENKVKQACLALDARLKVALASGCLDADAELAVVLVHTAHQQTQAAQVSVGTAGAGLQFRRVEWSV